MAVNIGRIVVVAEALDVDRKFTDATVIVPVVDSDAKASATEIVVVGADGDTELSAAEVIVSVVNSRPISALTTLVTSVDVP